MTPREKFKVAFLADLVERGLSLDEIHSVVKTARDKLVKSAVMQVPLAPSSSSTVPNRLPPMAGVMGVGKPSVASMPPKAPATGMNPAPTVGSPTGSASYSAGGTSPKIALDLGGLVKAFPEAAEKVMGLGRTGLIAAGGLGLGAGYGLGKLTDIDDTDAAEVKNQELVDQYRRMSEHLRRQRALHPY